MSIKKNIQGDVDLINLYLKQLPQALADVYVSGNFYCYNNRLTSLEGAPQHVGGNFACSSNRLTSLNGAPQHVGGAFSCIDNRLTSLNGAPQRVGGHFDCGNNAVKFTEAQVRAVCDVKGSVYV